jgi:hypothetical protein
MEASRALSFAGEALEQITKSHREPIVRIFENARHVFPQAVNALGDHDPILQEQASDLIDQRGPILHEPLANAVLCLDILLLDRFDRHRRDAGAQPGFREHQRIIGVTLLPVPERHHVLRSKQADLVPNRAKTSCPVVCTATCLHDDERWGLAGYQGQEFSSCHRRGLGHITVDTCGNLQFHIFLLA